MLGGAGGALWAAQTIEHYARRRLYPDGTPRPRLRRMWALCPPAPVRRYVVFVVTLVALLAYPAWVGRTAGGVAVLVERVLRGPGRAYRLRVVAVVALCDVALLVTIAAATVAGRLVGVGELLGVAVAGGIALVWAWLVVAGVREAIRLGSLRRKQAALFAETAGPVHLATELVTSARNVGAALVHALTARADAAGVTVIARTEAGPLVPFYVKNGFTGGHREAGLVGYRRAHGAGAPAGRSTRGDVKPGPTSASRPGTRSRRAEGPVAAVPYGGSSTDPRHRPCEPVTALLQQGFLAGAIEPDMAQTVSESGGAQGSWERSAAMQRELA